MEAARIGCKQCDDPRQLSVRAVAVGDQDQVVVVDRFEPFLRVFSQDGSPISAFGRFGDGPGELQRPGYAFVSSTGDIYVMDRLGRRLIRYREDGSVVAESRFEHFPREPAYAAVADRFFFASPHLATVRGESAVFGLEADGSAAQVITWGPDQLPMSNEDRPSINYPIAVSRTGQIAVGDYGLRYRVRLYAGDGSLRMEHSLDIPQRPKTEAELAAERAQFKREGMGMTPQPLKLHYYSGALAFDAEGTLWIRAGRSDADRTIFDLFDASGYLGAVATEGEIEERGRTFSVGRSVLAGVFTGPMGEDEIRVFRINRVAATIEEAG